MTTAYDGGFNGSAVCRIAVQACPINDHEVFHEQRE